MDNANDINIIDFSIFNTRRLLGRKSRPHYKSSLSADSYSSHGVLETVTPSNFSNEDILRVGIIAFSWPTWAVAFSHKRYSIEWILTFTIELVPLIKRCFPSILVIGIARFDWTRIAPVEVLALNGPLNKLLRPPPGISILILDWAMRIKGGWDDWRIYAQKMDHSKCGGVSDYVGTIKWGIHKSSSSFFTVDGDLLDAFPLASLGSILNHTENGEDLAQSPRLQPLSTPAVTMVSHKSHHPDGLFPSNANNPFFLIPSVFSSSRWVKRELSTKELLAVKDVPVSIISSLSQKERRVVYKSICMPVKCLSAFSSALFLKGLVTVSGGGDEHLDVSEDVVVVNKMEGEQVDVSEEVAVVKNVKEASTPIPLPMSASPFHTTTNIDSHIPGAWKENQRHHKDEKAAKNDDAGIPIHFWNNALAAKLGRSALTTAQEVALITLREIFGQRIWRRNITKCFCGYIRCNQCHHKKLTAKFDHKSSQQLFSCKRCKQQLPMAPRLQEVTWKGNKYRWVNEGRARYSRWYNVYMKRADLEESAETALDIQAGRDCIRRVIGCTAWSWPKGSRLFFWRWGEFTRTARDGAKVHVKGELPEYSKRQKAPSNERNLNLVQNKLNDVRAKGYIAKGEVISVTSLFDVPKGTDDIRLVYDATKSGLNEVCWAPWFSLQTCESHLRAVDPGTFMGDADLGEMFLNFPLDVDMRKYAGVDLTSIFPEEAERGRVFWERWVRMLMGFRPSPYLTTREMRRIDLFLRGAANNPNNVFRWSKVILNLPGTLTYTPERPRVYRVRLDNTMAADLFSYIDDLRNTGPTAVECWDGLHQVCSRLTWLGLQDAPRKRNGPTQTPRAWAGSIIHSDQELVTVLVSEEKWDKTKSWILWVLSHVEKEEGIPFKELLSCRGFLIYVSRTYTPFKPYLRGLHKTIDSWRPFRDKDGWKLMQSIIDAKLDDGYLPGPSSHLPPSKYIKPLPRLKTDFERLRELTKPEAPPKVIRRRLSTATAIYGFGDASGKGFGSSIEIRGHAHSEFGEWSAELEDKHSNYKELRNLVNAVVKAHKKGLLTNCELFLFTDNFVAECGYYNGGSNRNKDLDELVHVLWKLQMDGEFTLHVYHVAGTRMIASGIDGLSRGDKTEGISRGISVLNFVPIHQSPIERSNAIVGWIDSWWDDSLGKLHRMTPEDWFSLSMKKGNFLWDVPPGAGEVAVEQLCAHTHGRPESHHIFIIPRLCTCHWRKQLLKACDVVLTIQPKFPFWPTHMHEPLLVGIHFPLLPPLYKFRPWKLKHTEFVERFRSNLHRVQTTGESVDWDLLREFQLQARSIPTLSDGLARELLQDKVGRQLPNCKA